MSRQINKGKIEMFNRHEMLELVIVDGKARGIARNLLTGEIERHSAHAVVIASGGYGNVFSYPPTQWVQTLLRHGKFIRRCLLCKSLLHPDSPDLYSCFGDYQSKLTLMSESLRNDGRIWVPKKLEDVESIRSGKLKPTQIPEEDRDYYLERRYPAFVIDS